MAIFTIREYTNMAEDVNGNPLAFGREPASQLQKVTLSGTSQQLTLAADTKFVLIGADGIINWKIGSNPTAATGGEGRMAADEKQYFGVESGGRLDDGARSPLKIAVLTDS